MKYLITTNELENMIGSKHPNLKIVNATWYMPNSENDSWKEHCDTRITEDTVFFDHDIICDKTVNLPHTMPTL